MRRREFLEAAVTAGIAAGTSTAAVAQGEGHARVCEMVFFKVKIGDQAGRMDEWAEETLVPLAAKHGIKGLGCFQIEIGVDTPQLVFAVEHDSLEQLEKRMRAISEDPAWQEGLKKRESGEGPPFESAERRLLRATAYSPSLVDAVGKSSAARVFEWRVYHSPTWKQLQALHERFSGPEIRIFHRVGIRPVLYAETVFGPDMPNLTYLTPFDHLEAREKAWKAFRDDEEWKKVRAESVAAHGDIVVYSTRLILQAKAYSPIL